MIDMDICSNYELESESQDYNFCLVDQMPEGVSFASAFKSVFQDQLMIEDDLNDGNGQFLPKEYHFTQIEEKKLVISYEGNNTKKNLFNIFHPWSKEYNNEKVYAKVPKFKVNYGLDEEKQEEEEKEEKDEEEMEKEEESNSENKKTSKNKRKKRFDLMRKRIKSDCCSHIINNLNEKLNSVNIFQQFNYLPQCEIINVAKKENKKILNYTLKEMILYKAFDTITTKKVKHKDKEKKRKTERDKNIESWEKNKSLLEFLEDKKNEDIYKQLNLEYILNMKMKDIYKEYLASDEFQKSIEELIAEGKYYEYIHNYIEVAKNVLRFYNIEK